MGSWNIEFRVLVPMSGAHMEQHQDKRLDRTNRLRAKRIKRVKMQIEALEAMDYRLWRNAIFCALFMLFGLSSIVSAAWYYFNGALPLWMPPVIFLVVLTTVFLLRNWTILLWLALVSLYIAGCVFFLALEIVPDFVPTPPSPTDMIDSPFEKKSRLRLRVEYAISRNKKRLEKVLARMS
jgi:hypothetical protein